METLCYEVWKDGKMIHAYWNVQTAWKVMKAINHIYWNDEYASREAVVIVANGMEINVETQEMSKRTNVSAE